MALWLGLGAGPLAWAGAARDQLRAVLRRLRAAADLDAAPGDGGRAVDWSVPARWRPGPPRRRCRRLPASSTAEARARFMALGGLALCAWFALVILATDIPVAGPPSMHAVNDALGVPLFAAWPRMPRRHLTGTSSLLVVVPLMVTAVLLRARSDQAVAARRYRPWHLDVVGAVLRGRLGVAVGGAGVAVAWLSQMLFSRST